ncbi:serine hydrolase domain-containing protein [Sulfitobacter guttiformis]|uniref:Beta-lactamase class C n=1 Tax=Sulfitobacter guttiformis TaxID=74349 RepID=J7G4T2_9RHOB|nr:serine hydrolase domain-containing protein [Sulfitobacter guttiformis]AFP55451.1 beta-lactamase class C [Sulfitobacter guttiformis]KIN75421.1 Beta-lactamase class C [Sulfitobacter guttiformis KCTC 32187]RKE92073.1 CubicO group peptidase (beta-lactamase class C family) [Sulfitobacter guttiformis]
MPGFDKDRLNRIAGWMQSYVDDRRFAGASVLVAQGGREAYYHDCGLRDVASGLPWQRDTVARIYSMTKPVTSVALMMLAERGLIHLDAPLSDFIPSFKDMHCLRAGATSIDQTEACETPTLHQLLTHTSGLSYGFNPGVLGKAMAEQQIEFRGTKGTMAEMADRLSVLPLAFAPGTRWEYSVATDILGRVIEVITGKALEQVFIDEIFDPLGMNDTRFKVPAHAHDRFAACYTPLAGSAFSVGKVDKSAETLRELDGSAKSPFLHPQIQSGGGGLVGTIDDYLKFTEMMRTGGAGIIGPKTLAFMMRNHLGGDIASMGPRSFAEQPMEGTGFGLGGAIMLDPGRARAPGSIGDFSWGGMASTAFWIDPVNELSVIFFTQLIPSSSYPARPQLRALIHGALT